jgi:hypothetical protein
MEADLIWGSGPSDDLKDGEVELTIVATSFEATSHHEMESEGNSTVARGEDDEVLVKWNIIERYNNIDEIVKQPAYLRRRMQLMGSTAKGAKNNILSEEGNNNLPEENTLF